MKREYRDTGIKFWMKDAADEYPTVRMSCKLSQKLWEDAKSNIDAFFSEHADFDGDIMLYVFPIKSIPNIGQATHKMTLGQCYSEIISTSMKIMVNKLTGGTNGNT